MSDNSPLPAPVRLYVSALSVLSGLLVLLSLASLWSNLISRTELGWLLGSTILIALATARPIEMRPHVRLSVDTAPQLTAAILLDPAAAIVAATVGAVVGYSYHLFHRQRHDLIDLLFNTAQGVLVTGIASGVYHLASGYAQGPLVEPLALLAAAESLHITNILLVATAVTLSGQGNGFTSIFRTLLRDDLLQFAALLVTGILGALLARQTFWAVPLLLVPLALVERVLVKQREEEERNRKLAVMEQVNQLKNDFIAAVTHDLRTPLMVIKGFGELLAEREDELLDDERRAVDAINLNAERLSELIEMLLQMSELDAGMVVLQREPTDVPAVLRGVVDEIGYHAEQSGVAVKVFVRGAVPLVELDAARLEQVIANLLNNAIKFTPEGGEVKVAVDFRDEEMVLTVRDTGPGIPPDVLPHIFDRFYRGNTVAGERRQTGGLGLAIAKGIVELHGGTIDVESRLGEGTTFTVTLPRLIAQDAGEEGPDADDRALAGMLHPSRPLPNAR